MPLRGKRATTQKPPQHSIRVVIMPHMNIDHAPLASTMLRSDEECRRIATPIGSGFRYASLPLDEHQRRGVVALRALDLTLSEITGSTADPQIARRKLDWWRNALHQALTQDKAEHPILQSLLLATDTDIRHALIPRIESRLGAALIELDYQGFETGQDLEAYLEASGGAMFGLYGLILHAPPTSLDTLTRLGALHLRLYRLTYLGRHLQHGRIYLPAELLTEKGFSEADFHRPAAPLLMAPLLQAELSAIEHHYLAGVHALRRHESRPSALFRALIALDRAQIALLQRHRVAVLTTRPELTPFKRLTTAWWASKRSLPKTRPHPSSEES